MRRKSRRSRSSGLSELVAELEERGHPDLLLIVLDHRLHRPILVDDRADPAAEPAGAAARASCVSTTSGHSPPSDAPWYMPSSDLLSCPQGFLTCIRNSQTSSLVQSSIGV